MAVISLWTVTGYFFLGKLDKVKERMADVIFYNGHRQLDQMYRFIIPNKRSNLKVMLNSIVFYEIFLHSKKFVKISGWRLRDGEYTERVRPGLLDARAGQVDRVRRL
jgi:hypothetical protein